VSTRERRSQGLIREVPVKFDPRAIPGDVASCSGTLPAIARLGTDQVTRLAASATQGAEMGILDPALPSGEQATLGRPVQTVQRGQGANGK
jgi:hypothetical protein